MDSVQVAERGGMNPTHDVPHADGELDETTLRRVASSDEAARRFVECYQARVFALLARMLPAAPRATLEDLAQDTFLGALRALPSFDPRGAAKLSSWLLGIAARRAIDELRRRRPQAAAMPEPAASDRADDRVHRGELATAIESALAELSPELRAAFLLRELHDLDYDTIARELAIDLGTVKSRLSRARAQLRARLAEVR